MLPIVGLTLAIGCGPGDGPDEPDAGGPYPGPCRIEYDTDGDGTADSCWTETYNDLDLLDVVSIDTQCDLGTNTEQYHFYDGTLLVERRQDHGVDGTIDLFWSFDYSSMDLLERTECREDSLTGPLVYVRWYEYDGQGRNTVENYATLFEGEDPESWTVYQYTYDDSDNLIQEDTIEDAPDNTEVSDRRFYEYDEKGKLLIARYDADADGTIQATMHYTYDENDDLVLLEGYSGEDGPMFQLDTWEWDENHNLLEYAKDDDADGVNYIETYYYDCWEE